MCVRSKGLGFFDEPDYEWMKGKIQVSPAPRRCLLCSKC